MAQCGRCAPAAVITFSGRLDVKPLSRDCFCCDVGETRTYVTDGVIKATQLPADATVPKQWTRVARNRSLNKRCSGCAQPSCAATWWGSSVAIDCFDAHLTSPGCSIDSITSLLVALITAAFAATSRRSRSDADGQCRAWRLASTVQRACLSIFSCLSRWFSLKIARKLETGWLLELGRGFSPTEPLHPSTPVALTTTTGKWGGRNVDSFEITLKLREIGRKITLRFCHLSKAT